jgi:hypothetical protein
MIGLIIEDTGRMVNGLELMEEFKIDISYTDIQLLHQLIGRAKHIVDHYVEINNLQKKEEPNEITNQID